MSKAELKGYFEWFVNTIPKGVDELRNELRKSPEYKVWESDYTLESLNSLGNWFALNVETRQRTYQEIEEIRYRSPFPFDIADTELTNRTFSLAVDIGMYVSQIFVRNYPSLRWSQSFESKRSFDYGQPVLVEFDSGGFNPVHIIVTLAYGLASKNRTGRRLRDLYEVWSAKVKP
jgi:hypothetical protein